MDLVQNLINLFLHLDKNLAQIVQNYGILTYGLLFLIIFLETGIVVTPFLPGDSLLFVTGAFAANKVFDILPLWLIITLAAIIGDTVNYWIGHFVGPKVFKENVRFLKKEYLTKTEKFYEKYGGKTIILARFVPIVRTFAPFVAGIGKMTYGKFISYNIFGGLAWVSLFIFGGYFFGNLPIVKKNFHTVVLLIIILSIIPGVIEYIKHKQETKRAKEAAATYQDLKETFKREHLD